MEFKEYLKNNKNIDIYFDMDGVFAEYDTGNFDYNTIRPIKSVIKLMKELIDDNINVKILSICKNNKIVEEKYNWLKKNLPFFNKKNAIFLSKEEIPNVESNELKSNYLKNNIDKSHTNILVDDDILVIKKIVKENQDVKVFHVSSIIE